MKIALQGGAYEARSLIASAQRCLNLFPEPMPQGQGEPMPMAHYPTPGTTLLGTIGTGPIRGIHQGTQGNVFVVSGDNLYHVDTTAWTGTVLGTLTQGLKTPASMSDNGNELVIVDGTANGWVVELPSLNFQSIVQQNTQTPIPSSTTAPIEAGTALYSPFTAQWNGEIGSATVTLDTGYTGNLQCGVFASAGGVPTDVLGFANVIANPVSGVNQLSFPMSIVLAKGTQYWLGFDSDTSDGAWTVGPGMRGATSTTDFASFPEANPATSTSPSVVVSITISNDPQGVFAGADRVDYLDTYFVFNKPNTPQFYISGSLAVTFDPLDFANKESYSDLLVVAVVAKRLLYLFGRRTTEIWYDAGPSPLPTNDPTAPPVSSFPFAAMQSEVFIDHGIVAKYSPAIYDNMCFWLTRDRQGQGIVLMVAGYETRRVSTFAIEAAIFGYNEIDDAIGFCYQLAGHSCYVLTFPSADKTWVYDISAQLWHEWCWIDANGTEHRHRANCFSPVNNLLVVGDWQNGNLYALDNDVYTDNGQPIKRLRSFPHLLADGRRVFYREFLADVATGNAPQMLSGIATRLNATFTAPDYTPLAVYTSEVGGGWTPVSGEANATIISDAVTGTGGTALYQSGATLLTPNYTLRFSVIPPAYSSVVSGTSMWIIGRATGANTGYQAMVSADGTQYHLTLSVLPGGAMATVAMGTLASGTYTVSLAMLATTITVQAQRTQDALYLRGDGTWQPSDSTIAGRLTDATYTAPGVIMIGGTWPTPALMYTLETRNAADPDFPIPPGYTSQGYQQAFDFGRNWFYQPIYHSPNGGITVTDLSTMDVIKTATLNQMYAGTPYGHPTGSPPTQTIHGITSGNGTDLFILMDNGLGFGVEGEFCRFTRVNPVTMKVTGEWYVSAAFPPPIVCVMPGGAGGMGAVSTTATHTIVAYATNGGLGKGPEIFDGTGMAPIGLATAPTLNPYKAAIIAGAKRTDGSCDFIYLNPDWNGTSGNIEIWRINVTDALTFTDIRTGVVNTLSSGVTGGVFVQQANYDSTHDTIILEASNNTSPGSIMSVNYDGSINWVQESVSVGDPFGTGQSLLNGTTVMEGNSDALTIYNTATGAITYTGSVIVEGTPAGSFYHVWDASRMAYWTYALSRGFVRIGFPAALAMDNVTCIATATLLNQNLISLRWSDDRGHSYGSPVAQSIGEIGRYKTSLQWQRLGMTRDRIFEVSWSVPCKTALQGCWLTAEPGDAEQAPQSGQGQG